MTTFDLSEKLKGNDGEPGLKQTLANVLSELLGQQTKQGPVKAMKMWEWHKQLQVSTELQLDDTDQKDLVALIENAEGVFLFVKGQLIDALNKK